MFGLRRLARLSFAAVAAMALFAGDVAHGAPDRHTEYKEYQVKLRDRTLRIPDRYLDDFSRIPSWLRWLPGLDDDLHSILMVIPASDVAAHVPGYVTRNKIADEDLHLIVSVLTDVELQRSRYPSWVRDIWRAEGLYKRRFFREDPDTGFYNVLEQGKDDRWWDMLTLNPDDFPLYNGHYAVWLGSCIASSGENPAGVKRSCSSFVLYENFHIHFRMRDKNIRHVKKIRMYLVEQLKEWIEKGEKRGDP